MREKIDIQREEIARPVDMPDIDELPLPVVPDWDALVAKSEAMAKIIDRHLDYETIYQGHNLNPAGLCPQQRVNLISDLASAR